MGHLSIRNKTRTQRAGGEEEETTIMDTLRATKRRRPLGPIIKSKSALALVTALLFLSTFLSVFQLVSAGSQRSPRQTTDEFAPLDAATLQKFVDVLPSPPTIYLTYSPPGASNRIRERSDSELDSESEDSEGTEEAHKEEKGRVLETRQTAVVQDDFPDAPEPDEDWTTGKQWEAANGGKVPKSVLARARSVNIKMGPCRHKFHSSLKPTTLFCYNGVYPGPTVIGRRFRSAQITWTNMLPSSHLLLPQLVAASNNPYTNISTKATVHLHGAQSTGGANDGHPMSAYPRGRSQTSWYPNLQKASHLFYHDHAMGATAPNFYSGLYGNYLIRDGVEDQLIAKKQLPPRDREIPLTIADKLVSPSGSLIYALSAGVFVGNAMSVNGKLYPYTVVQATTYRFRMLNACQGRFLNLWFETSFPGVKAWIVGNDGGLLDAPVAVGNLTTAPVSFAERRIMMEGSGRVDLVVDFSGVWKSGAKTAGDSKGWREVKLVNSAPYYWPGAPITNASTLYHVMQFRVARPRSRTYNTVTKLPDTFPKDPWAGATADQIATIAAQRSGDRRVSRYGYARPPGGRSVDPATVAIDRYRNHSFNVAMDPNTMLPVHQMNNLGFKDIATELPVLGTFESWRICNSMNMAHPIHLHAVVFAITGRRAFDVAIFAASGDRKTVVYTGKPLEIKPEERGWKDMVVTVPGECVNITVAVEGFAGQFMWHCHSLEHEDSDMMRPLNIQPVGSPQQIVSVETTTTTTTTITVRTTTTTTAFTRTPEPLGPGPFSTHVIEVAPFDEKTGKYLSAYKPNNLTINLGDTVTWKWSADPTQPHSVSHYQDASICRKFPAGDPQKLFEDGSGNVGKPAGSQFSYQFVNRGKWSYACEVGEHCLYGMKGVVYVV